ncbi:MAG: DUF927 domain-containing protein [Alicyclobacillus sp.]|nr:DUF927 domain-containing protein [Alicyclobacillus sp.]
MAVSPFGYPGTSDGGLVNTWNGTQNAVVAHLRDNHGMPTAFDEAAMQGGDFTKMIYMLVGGRLLPALTNP